ncbi:phage portal protein, SPP1 family [Gottschalkia purinilytica]|uniref:Phage portal protein, SPP1 family n=1 Tax=Gottschalkia purinilytica TaxID=1503 RepID=A0A0L0W7A6_GOTPU|nr:phage portal protein [Gottschalkia purinilytica]KNF07160.1 phage portal protein, SPP1 family [Gottschalkia purinilytica]
MITYNELLNQKLIYDNKIIDSVIIKDLINTHDTSHMIEGHKYYHNENDILDRKKYHYPDGQKVEDETKANCRIPHNWHKLLVDQKVAYLVGKPVVLQVDKKEYEERLNLILGEEWDDVLTELATNSSNKGTEWLHTYINEEGKFKYIIIPAEEIIPIYDTSLQENLEAVLRYYLVEVNGKERIRVEWWTRDTVSFYIETDNGDFILDDTESNNPDSHYYYNNKGYGWGKVPFIEFPNNEARYSDLKYYKELIDSYDRNVSDLDNNLLEIQEIITILKGYEGTELKEFHDNLRYYKAIKVNSEPGSGVDKLELNIPIEAKKEMLDRLEENIFIFGQGVNMKTDKFGNSPSGEALKFLYSLLDLKASIAERKLRKAIKRFLWFATEYINIIDNKSYDNTIIQVTFRKTMITNDRENVEIASQSKGIISDETIVANHPWVEDVGKELKKIEEQNDYIEYEFENKSKEDGIDE